MSVIPFQPRNDPQKIANETGEQHGAGEAFCIACDFRWTAVAPTGTTQLECPSCRAHKGRFKFEFVPSEGQLVRTCACDCQLFYLTPAGHMCCNCGIYQSYR